MTLYVDSSALLKRYLAEPESEECEALLRADSDWVTARHTLVEVRRNLARTLMADELLSARLNFERDWERVEVVELIPSTCEAAAEIAEATGAKTLDALHLAAALVAGAPALTFLTYDLTLATVGRSLGWTVLGT